MGDYISCRVTFSILFSTKDVSFWHIYVLADQKTKSSTLKKAFQDVTCQYYFTVHSCIDSYILSTILSAVISGLSFPLLSWFAADLSNEAFYRIHSSKGAQLGNFERGAQIYL